MLALLEEQLQKLDKEIGKEEKGLVHLNKQLGNKISKLKDLKDQRWKISVAYKQASRESEIQSAILELENNLEDLARS